MRYNRSRTIVASACGALLSMFTTTVLADEATGKVVWFDAKNASLLIECPDKGCPQIPNSKTGETYTFVVPAGLMASVAQLKEGQTVTLVYDDGKEKGYLISAVK